MPPIDPHEDRGLIGNRWLAVPLAAAFAAGVAQRIALPTNADAAWYLYMGGRILDGARPYRDLVDTNPPLIVLASMAAEGLARVLRCPVLAVFPALVFAAIGLSLAMAWRFGRCLPAPLRQAGAVTWAYLLMVNVGAVFGQREHLFLILTLPYAQGAVGELAGRGTPTRLAILSGVMAGLGFAIKPFFVVPLVLVEMLLASRRGWRAWLRPEALAIAGVFAAYAAVILAWTPEYFDVARRFAPLYPHYTPGGAMLLASSWRVAAVAWVVAMSWKCVGASRRGWVFVEGAMAAGLVATVYLTGKGWPYHWFPAVAVAVAMLSGASAVVIARQSPRIRRLGGVLGLVVAVPVLSLGEVIQAVRVGGDQDCTTRLVRDHARPGDAVLVLTPWVHTAFPMINEAGVAWGMRHPMLWQIGAFYAAGPWEAGGYHPLGAMGPAERRFVGEVAEDFRSTRPILLLVDADPPLPKLSGFDYLAYLSLDPRFRQGLASYEFLGKAGNFRVYRRKGKPAPPSAPPATAALR